jgi:T4 RnlA family RNA ligase
MLAVQRYLQNNSFDDLEKELGIKLTRHESLPLIICNYNQIESPKMHPVVRECRGLVLNYDSHEVVAKSFDRFFNWGEVAEEMDDFDFADFCVQSKEDGSLALLYHFDGEWRANTRGSFALDDMQFQSFTWQQAICKAVGETNLEDVGLPLNPKFTFVCEFCSPWNKVVRRYKKPVLYLLSAFDPQTLEELTLAQCDSFAHSAGMLRPTLYEFKSIEEIQKFLQDQAENDPTYEGVVMRDKHGHRWKIKSATYLGLHRIKGNDTFNPKHLLPFILAGEEDELLTYFEEVREKFYEAKSRVLEEYIGVLEAWGDHHAIDDQKEFALSIKDQTGYPSVLFNVRKKYGKAQKASDVRQEWRESEHLILKRLFKSGHQPDG